MLLFLCFMKGCDLSMAHKPYAYELDGYTLLTWPIRNNTRAVTYQKGEIRYRYWLKPDKQRNFRFHPQMVSCHVNAQTFILSRNPLSGHDTLFVSVGRTGWMKIDREDIDDRLFEGMEDIYQQFQKKEGRLLFHENIASGI